MHARTIEVLDGWGWIKIQIFDFHDHFETQYQK